MPTIKQRLTYTRNRVKGQIAMAHACCRSAFESGVVSKHDETILRECYADLNLILKRWDKHYISKLNKAKDKSNG